MKLPIRETCLSETELTRLIEGEVRLDQQEGWATHLERCPECRMVMRESSEHLQSADAAERPGRVGWRVLAILVGLLFLWMLRR